MKTAKKIKLISLFFIAIFLTLGLSISLQSLFAAWTAPTGIPPSNNIVPPVPIYATSTTDQIISNSGSGGGGLGVVGNFSVGGISALLGKVGIGTANPVTTLDVNGKITAQTPLDSDSDNTVATKGYVRAQAQTGSSITTGLFSTNSGVTRFFSGCGLSLCCGYSTVDFNGIRTSANVNLNSVCETSKKCGIAKGSAAGTAECLSICPGVSGLAADGTCDGDNDGFSDATAGGNDGNDNNASIGQIANEPLVNNVHTTLNCLAAGGTIYTSGGVKFCRFAQGYCPSGWTGYLNWSTTHCISVTISYYSGSVGSCSLVTFQVVPYSCHNWSDTVDTAGPCYSNACWGCYGGSCGQPCAYSTGVERGCY